MSEERIVETVLAPPTLNGCTAPKFSTLKDIRRTRNALARARSVSKVHVYNIHFYDSDFFLCFLILTGSKLKSLRNCMQPR